MTLHELYVALFIGGLVLLASIAATRLATGAGLPSLLLFLGVGVLVGEGGLGLHFDNAQLAQDLGTAALGVILVEGGLTTRFADIRAVLAPAAVLATVGVVVSTLITAVAAHLLLGMNWQLALLLGAIVSSTDAAAVFSVLRVVPLPRRLGGLLEAESGFNDAPAVILVLLFSVTPLVLAPGADRRDPGLRVGGRCADRARLRVPRGDGVAPHRVARGRPLPAGDVRARHAGVRRRGFGARERFPGGLPGRRGARQFRAAAPLGDPLVRRGLGLAGADRAVRHPRPAGVPRRAARRADPGGRRRAGAAAAGPAAVGRAVAVGFSGAVARAGVPVLCRAARRGAHRAGDLSDRGGRAGQRPAAQHRVHPRRAVHPGAGAEPAAGRRVAGPDPARHHPRDPGRRRAVGRAGRRTADDDGRSRSRGCTTSRCWNCGCPTRVSSR